MTWQEHKEQIELCSKSDKSINTVSIYTYADIASIQRELLKAFADELLKRIVSKIGEPYKSPETIINELLTEAGVER